MVMEVLVFHLASLVHLYQEQVAVGVVLTQVLPDQVALAGVGQVR
jgi:hypothetical protein